MFCVVLRYRVVVSNQGFLARGVDARFETFEEAGLSCTVQ